MSDVSKEELFPSPTVGKEVPAICHQEDSSIESNAGKRDKNTELVRCTSLGISRLGKSVEEDAPVCAHCLAN